VADIAKADISKDVASARAGLSRNLVGILTMIAGTASFVINDACTKSIGETVPPGEILAVRGVLSCVLLLGVGARLGAIRIPMNAVLRPAFGLRLLGEIGGTMAFVVSLMHIRFADAQGIQQFQPLAVTAASAVFLGASVGWRRWTAALAGLAGVLLIVKPGAVDFNPYTLMSVSCVLFVALRDLATKAIPATIPSLSLALSSAAGVMVGGAALSLSETWHPMSYANLVDLGAAALFLVGGYLFVTKSVRTGELSVVAPFRYTGVVFSLIVQLVVWGTLPDNLSLAGMGIVAIAGLYTFYREQLRMRSAGRALAQSD
jgi:drug/metabolite transporter (DMT)-like permease